MVAKPLLVHRDQPLSMLRLLGLHLVKLLGRGWICFAQPVGEIGVDAAVFFLQLNGQRQDLPLAQISEVFIGQDCSSSVGATDTYALGTAR